MSNARKLQTEIDRVMKKVDEGCELFDEIWLKVKNADTQNLKEKHEDGLKKEIKKLQRLRDQIKTWIGSSDVKDKDALIDARKRIETKMEQFKICEKETKTKTYSKEGLAREEKLDPAEEAKLKTATWVAEYIEKFQQIVEEKDFEIEKLSSGKGKKTNKHQIEDLQEYIANHKYHISKLEGIIRLVNNDVLDVEPVDLLKEDLDYYLEEYEDEDYRMAYDEEIFYESLGLEELDVVNVDRVTQPAPPAKKGAADDATSTTSSRGNKESKAKKNAVSSVIPLTIGRARSKAEKKAEREKEKEREENEKNASTPTKVARSNSATAAPAAAKATPAPPAPAGASMAAILKRETEQQEKERQKALKEQQLRQQQAAQLKQQEQLRQQEALRQQQQQQAQQEALQRQQQQEALRQQQAQQQAQQEAAAKQQAAAQIQAQQRAAAEQKAIQSQQMQQQQQQQQAQSGQGNALDMLTSGLGGLGLGGTQESRSSDSGSLQLGGNAQSAGANPGSAPGGNLDAAGSTYLTALNESFVSAPASGDNERSRQYTPQNPYPTPASYPGTPSAIFDNPAVFEKLGTDCLFFIFYYAQGTYQQYLAARELKKQSWRFHKKYMTWFQRHEEPKITTDEYEQGTYVYFDYETGWCTRIKQDFRFEYSFLEDSLQ